MAKNKPTLRDQFIMAALSACGGGSWNGTAARYLRMNEYDSATQMAGAAIRVADEILRLTERDDEGNPLTKDTTESR